MPLRSLSQANTRLELFVAVTCRYNRYLLSQANTRLELFVTAAALPESAQPGDTLHGSYTLAKLAAEARGATKRPKGFAVSLVVPPAQVSDAVGG